MSIYGHLYIYIHNASDIYLFVYLFIHFFRDHLIVAPFDIVTSLFWFFSSFLGMVQDIAI